jgi:hypothetical protein
MAKNTTTITNGEAMVAVMPLNHKASFGGYKRTLKHTDGNNKNQINRREMNSSASNTSQTVCAADMFVCLIAAHVCQCQQGRSKTS